MSGPKRALFVGRWQPCHLGHEWLIRRKLDAGIPVLIWVRDIEPNAANPYTTDETIEILRAGFEGAVVVESLREAARRIEPVVIMAGPDVDSLNWGRGVGYEVNDHGECPIPHISATAIRASLEAGESGVDSWESKVSERVAVKLREIHGR